MDWFSYVRNKSVWSLTRDSFETSHGVSLPLALRLFAVLVVESEHIYGDHVPVRAFLRKDALIHSWRGAGALTQGSIQTLGYKVSPGGLKYHQ